MPLSECSPYSSTLNNALGKKLQGSIYSLAQHQQPLQKHGWRVSKDLVALDQLLVHARTNKQEGHNRCPSAHLIGKAVLDIQLGSRPLLPLEEKVEAWSKEHPVIWNIGIGPTASFAPTLSRLLQERSMELYGPHDLIIHLKVASSAAGSTINHAMALEAFMAIAGWLNIKELSPELQELKQLAVDESYYGYGTVSEDLMLRAWGREYVMYYGSAEPLSVRFDPLCERQPTRSPIRERILEASSQGKRYLLVVENLHAPVSLDVLIFAMNKRPSLMHNQWLISPTSTDVYNKSKSSRWTGNIHPIFEYHIQEGYYHAVPRGDLGDLDWSMLITEALKDAARRILQLQQDHGCLYYHPSSQGDDDKYWLHIAHHCLYYAILYHGPVKVVAADEGNLNNRKGRNRDNPKGAATKNSPPLTISSDELVRCWVAENLVSSSPNGGNPGTPAKKQSNYRSAYQAGKLVIQALQEYSLLPGPAKAPQAQGRSTFSPSQAAVVTGVSVLAKGVPRLQQGEFLVPDNKRWVSFMGDDGKHISWLSRKNAEFTPAPGEMIMTTLILRCCSDVSGFPLEQVLNCHIRVLDLSYTSIQSLPSSFCRLLNLRLLSLRGCSKLKTLSPPPTSETPPPLAYMGKLQVLDINGTPLVRLTRQDVANKSNLHYLDLSGSRVTALPSGFFCEMLNLEELILCNCSNLTKLPLSIAQLSNLLVLHVQGTQITTFPEDMFEAMPNLHTLNLTNNTLLLSLPRSLSEAKGLKELHIYNCVSLGSHFLRELTPYVEHLYIQTWDALEHIKVLGHPNLTTFTLSGPWVRSLSLNGCSSLKIVNIGDELMALEDVDLSGTALEEIPHNLPNLPQLRMLLLLNVPCLKRFPWHLLVRFPKVFFLDHCTGDCNHYPKMSCSQEIYADGNRQYTEEAVSTAQVNITDSRIFYSFNRDVATKLVKEGRFLQSFNVQVKSCSARGSEEAKMKQGERIQRQSPYLDVHSDEAASIVPMIKLQPKQRHVEISANNQCPQGLRHLLSVTNSIFLIDDTFVECLTDLNYSLMWLEECQIEHCNQMTVVLRMSSESEGSESLSSLKILQASNLNLLRSFVEPAIMSDSSLMTLEQLKHIHLEHCPRLEKIFPCSLSLPALETLVILFCSSLKTIFYNQTRYEVAPSPLPNIKSIYLQELPQLQHIHDDVMFRFQSPKLEKLFLRGCQSFHRLPLLKREYLNSKVEVSGEHDWWDKLQLTLPEQSGYYVHVPAPGFVSFKKHIIQSYLR